jgi:hypothetical protein
MDEEEHEGMVDMEDYLDEPKGPFVTSHPEYYEPNSLAPRLSRRVTMFFSVEDVAFMDALVKSHPERYKSRSDFVRSLVRDFRSRVNPE